MISRPNCGIAPAPGGDDLARLGDAVLHAAVARRPQGGIVDADLDRLDRGRRGVDGGSGVDDRRLRRADRGLGGGELRLRCGERRLGRVGGGAIVVEDRLRDGVPPGERLRPCQLALRRVVVGAPLGHHRIGGALLGLALAH
jgi:hypothetical protein